MGETHLTAHDLGVIEDAVSNLEKTLAFKADVLRATGGRNPDLRWVQEMLKEIDTEVRRIRMALYEPA